MIHALRTWLLGVILTAFAAGLARQIVPQGREQAMVRLAGGLLLTLALLRPLAALPWADLAVEAGSFRAQTREQEEEYRKNQQEAFSSIIEEKTETYIWDKASELGLACEVSVTAKAGEARTWWSRRSGIPSTGARWWSATAEGTTQCGCRWWKRFPPLQVLGQTGSP